MMFAVLTRVPFIFRGSIHRLVLTVVLLLTGIVAPVRYVRGSDDGHGAADDRNVVCGSAFSDVASKTLRASIVFDGRADRRVKSSATDVVFKVRTVFKGDLPRRGKPPSTTGVVADAAAGAAAGGDDRPFEEVVVGPFGEKADVGGCMAPPVVIGSQYVVFLDESLPADTVAAALASSSSTNRTKSKLLPTNRYRIAGFPESSSKTAIKEVQEFSCSKCKGWFLMRAEWLTRYASFPNQQI